MSHSKLYYRMKMMEYDKAKDKLYGYEYNLNYYLNSCTEYLRDFKDVYKAEDTLRGEVMDNFNYESEELFKRIDRLFDKIGYDVRTVSSEQKISSALYEEYKRLYEGYSGSDD